MKRETTLVDCYGILVKPIVQQAFMKWVDNNNIAMNTYTEVSRREMVVNFNKQYNEARK